MFTLNSEYRKMEQAKLTFQNELLETLTEIHNTPNDITSLFIVGNGVDY